MATSESRFNIDLSGIQSAVAGQFRGLDPNDPSSWPIIPRYAACMAVLIAVAVLLWFVWIKNSDDELTAARGAEQKLRADFKAKLGQSINIELLKDQQKQVLQFVNQMERQLPSKAEIDTLLQDVNKAGVERRLQFELFKPNPIVVKEYYAELPIELRVTGSYHDFAGFASDIANLSRIVTLGNLSFTPVKDGLLTISSTARTFRYLDPDEVKGQQAVNRGKPKK